MVWNWDIHVVYLSIFFRCLKYIFQHIKAKKNQIIVVTYIDQMLYCLITYMKTEY